jgi:site-specific DNA-methyltransferase (adenine-specific)
MLVEEIVVSPLRVRRDLGDIAGLAADIERLDFMFPILVCHMTNELIDGQRRLEAAKLLGWKRVPVAVVPTVLTARGEIVAHNQKAYTWAERTAVYKAIRPLIAVAARERRRSGLRRGTRTPDVGNRPHGKTGRTRDLIAAYMGDISGKTLEQAVAVFDSEHDDLKKQIEQKGTVNRAYRTLQRRRQARVEPTAPAPHDTQLRLGDCREVLAGLPDDTFHAVITDPPYGIGFQYADGVEEAATPDEYAGFIAPIFREMVRVVRPGGLVALWQSRKYIRYLWNWFGDDIKPYFACHGHVSWRNEVMADAVDPVVFFWKPGADPVRPARQHGSKNFHVSHMQFDEVAREHPCPRPLDVCEHVIANFVPEGGYVLDPFAGSGSILVAAEHLGHPWLGVERNPDYRRLALNRLALHGRPATGEMDADG